MLITSGSKRVNVKLEMPEYGLVKLMIYVTHFSYLFCDVRFRVLVLYTMGSRLFVLFSVGLFIVM